jgi:hypothetical protein
MTKRLNELQVGDRVSVVDGTVLAEILTVTRVRRTGEVPAIVMLDGGRFWPTGADDLRTVDTV